jgi:hypothetical protein
MLERVRYSRQGRAIEAATVSAAGKKIVRALSVEHVRL